MRLLLALAALVSCATATDSFNGHPVVLDGQGRLLPWYGPPERAYDHFLRLRWQFVQTRAPLSPGPPPRSDYPQYFFYCAYWNRNGAIEPDTFMNDVGEKVPNWFESARLYYAYSGDDGPMRLVQRLIDYTLDHGLSPASFAWAHFPYTTTNAGDLDFRGFTSAKRFVLHEIQVDHAAEIGLTFFRMYQFTGEGKYLTAAVRVADTLARTARTGTAERSVWPYRVVMDTGRVTAEYGANWTGAVQLLDHLILAKHGNVRAYRAARAKAREFLLRFPLRTGYWTDGHSDNPVNSNTYKSNLSASNYTLHILDDPDFDPDFHRSLPALIRWTEENFVTRCAPGEPASQWGANIVGEQDGFMHKMDYQTARYAAACARWYALSGDESYKERAFRSLNWVTYCNDDKGLAFESPVSKNISNWWSDTYGECPRMFYHALAAVPEWAPPGESHILYSPGILRRVTYLPKGIDYEPTTDRGVEYIRTAFRPTRITAGGRMLRADEDYTLRSLDHGDFALTIRRNRSGPVSIR